MNKMAGQLQTMNLSEIWLILIFFYWSLSLSWGVIDKKLQMV